jgi:hypothetical protein
VGAGEEEVSDCLWFEIGAEVVVADAGEYMLVKKVES